MDEPTPLANQAPRAAEVRSVGLLGLKRALHAGETAYVLGELLGEGRTSSVCRAQMNHEDGDSHLVAVKKTIYRTPQHMAQARVNTKEGVDREVDLHVRCHDHPNVATVYDLVQVGNAVHLVMELGTEGDLLSFVHSRHPLPRAQVVSLFSQLASAVAHIHACGIAHRDIKPENVVLTNNGETPLVCDFGSAVEFRRGDALLTEAEGTLRCCPPEVRNRSEEHPEYDPLAMDVYALGVCGFYLQEARFPTDADVDAVLGAVLDGDPNTDHPPLALALKTMLQPQPVARATMEQVAGFLNLA